MSKYIVLDRDGDNYGGIHDNLEDAQATATEARSTLEPGYSPYNVYELSDPYEVPGPSETPDAGPSVLLKIAGAVRYEVTDQDGDTYGGDHDTLKEAIDRAVEEVKDDNEYTYGASPYTVTAKVPVATVEPGAVVKMFSCLED